MPIDLPTGVTASVLDEVSSTMDVARSYAGPMPHWILARSQTQARGRRGRTWLNMQGAFAATLVFDPVAPPAQAALRSFVAACALFEALAKHTSATRLKHKWPNDVLFDGGKVAGILLEAEGAGGAVRKLLIGVGVNLGRAPAAIEDAAFQPIGLNTSVQPEAFLTDLAQAFQRFETRFAKDGFAPIKDQWMDHAARLGETITAKTSRDSFTGTFQGIDDQGQLLLLTAEGPRAIPAADVYF